MNLEQKDIQQLNQFDSFLSFIVTDNVRGFLNSTARIRACFTGNQAMKTSSSMYDLTLRLMGSHPIPKRNFDYYVCDDGHTFNIPTYKRAVTTKKQSGLPTKGASSLTSHETAP